MRSVSVLLLVLLIISMSTPGRCETSVLISSGIGEASIFPDKAEIQFNIVSEGEDSDIASTETARKYKEIAAQLKKLGFQKDDIITIAFRVNNIFMRDKETGQNVTTGYTARHGIKLVVTDFTKIGIIVDTALKAGATNLARISFSSTKIDDIQNIALAEAVKRAHKKAEIMAHTVGGELGKLLEMETGRNRGDVQITSSDGGSSAAPTTMIPDIINVNVRVTAKWEYLPQER